MRWNYKLLMWGFGLLLAGCTVVESPTTTIVQSSPPAQKDINRLDMTADLSLDLSDLSSVDMDMSLQDETPDLEDTSQDMDWFDTPADLNCPPIEQWTQGHQDPEPYGFDETGQCERYLIRMHSIITGQPNLVTGFVRPGNYAVENDGQYLEAYVANVRDDEVDIYLLKDRGFYQFRWRGVPLHNWLESGDKVWVKKYPRDYGNNFFAIHTNEATIIAGYVASLFVEDQQLSIFDEQLQAHWIKHCGDVRTAAHSIALTYGAETHTIAPNQTKVIGNWIVSLHESLRTPARQEGNITYRHSFFSTMSMIRVHPFCGSPVE